LKLGADAIRKALADLEADYSIVESVDPFCGVGLIDILPERVSKAYAVDWWRDFEGLSREDVVFAGDSGNDLAALIAGYRSILVSNADSHLVTQVREVHQRRGWTDLLYVAETAATSGVWEGCVAHGLFTANGREDSV